MDTRRILVELRIERDRIEEAISAIESLTPKARRGRPSLSPRNQSRPKRRHRMSAAGRRRISEMMKQRWAERRKKAKAA